jgi:tetratricopeptide (TPR) repeat protein
MQEHAPDINAMLAVKNLDSFNPDQALNFLGELTDLSLDMESMDGLRHAVTLGEELLNRDIEANQRSVLHYFLSNAWSNQRALKEGGEMPDFGWQQEEIVQELHHLRESLAGDDGLLSDDRICQILTNLGNSMSHVGRFTEAIAYWDASLARMPASHLARGNRALGLVWYAQTLYNGEHWEILLRQAHTELKTALLLPIHDDAKAFFDTQCRSVEEALGPEALERRTDLSTYPSAPVEADVPYLQWCLEQRLFLNPLNELGAHPIAAQDVLVMPTNAGDVATAYDTLKHAYAAARVVAYEALEGSTVEDTESLADSLSGLFNASAHVLATYLDLGISDGTASLSTLWYEGQDFSSGLLPSFTNSLNWSLRGLYAMGKDLENESASPPGTPSKRLLWLLKRTRETLLCLALAVYTEERLKRYGIPS